MSDHLWLASRRRAAAPPIDPCIQNIGPVTGADCHSATGLLVWLKADAGIGLLDGQSIPTWSDQSGNGHNGARGVALEQPIFSTSIAGGGPAVRFTDAGMGLDIATLSVVRSSYTFYFLVRYDPGQTDVALLLSSQSVNGGVIVRGDSPLFGGDQLVIQANTGAGVQHYETLAHCGWQAIAAVYDAPNSLMSLYRNGVSVASGSYSPGTETDTSWVIGSASGFAVGFVFDLSELMIYSVADSPSTVASVSTCLRNRWSLQAGQGI